MKLFSVAITAEERAERGFARLINEVLHAVHETYLHACAHHRGSTITITVTAEEPKREHD